MNTLDCVKKLFEIYPDQKRISIFRSESGNSVLSNTKYIAIHFDGSINDTINGNVDVDYKQNPTKYTCKDLYDGEGLIEHNISDELKMSILEMANQVSMDTAAPNDCSIEIYKRDEDYRLAVPEIETKHYWASRYWEVEEEDLYLEC